MVRLLFALVRLSNLVHGSYQITLFDDPKKTLNLYAAMDKIRLKYDSDAVGRALKGVVGK
ncbi:MAG: hypothetical protein ACTHJT_10000 [Cytophaga sp.]|uniref:hypothetical protein n=1 Tax=Cytophaga sp. TaxID=29535 RepID=UPI003F7ECE2A